jgi:trehalose 6-phosphate phosphatase
MLEDHELIEGSVQKNVRQNAEASLELVASELAQQLDKCAILLDIDGTLVDLAPTPREVWVPPGLAKTLTNLREKTSGALALVSGRSLNDIDLIFAPD